jgi:hypothetical protein
MSRETFGPLAGLAAVLVCCGAVLLIGGAFAGWRAITLCIGAGVVALGAVLAAALKRAGTERA